MTPATPDIAYKILTASQWEAWRETGTFAGAPVDLADGFIHLSASDQVQGTLDKHFAEHDRLFLVEIGLPALGDAVRWETSRGGALFPHVYAPLLLENVLNHRPLERLPDGRWDGSIPS